MPKASIITVAYKSADVIQGYLVALKNQTTSDFEVIIVDNDSRDGIVDQIEFDKKRLKLISSKENLGFSKGNNLGAKQADGEVLIFLNPDTRVQPDFVEKITARARQEAMVGVGIQYTSGELQMGGSAFPTFRSFLYDISSYKKFFPKSPSFQRYLLSDWDRLSARHIDAVPGACFAMRRKIYDQIGGLDENYFLFFEEYDLGRSMQKIGHQPFFDSSILITHITHAATDQVSSERITKIYNQSRDYYITKHHGKIYLNVLKASCRAFDILWKVYEHGLNLLKHDHEKS